MSHEDAQWARTEVEQRRRETEARERRAVAEATARYRVLVDELESLRRAADEACAAHGVTVAVPDAEALNGTTSDQIARENAALAEVVAHIRVSIHVAEAGAHSARQLQEYLSGLQEIDVPTSTRGGWLDAAATRSQPTALPISASEAAGVESAKPSIADVLTRADRYIGALAPGARLSDEAHALLVSLASATPEFAAIAVRELQAEVSRSNREAESQNARAERLRELDVRARTLDHAELAREVLVARGMQSELTDAGLDALELHIARAEEVAAQAGRSAAAEADRQHVQAVLLAALESQGYEVLSGFESAVPAGGTLLRKPGYGYHAVQATVDRGTISMDVVRTTLEADAGVSGTRDLEAHVALHADMRRALDRVRADGVELGRVRDLEPGDIPIPALPTATQGPVAPRTRAKPKEQRL